MQSSRALGVFALCAVILAAISFAAVDVVIGNAGPNAALPVTAVAYALTGTLALLASAVPAFIWFARAIEHPRHEADIDPIPARVPDVPADDAALATYVDDEL